MLKHPNDPGILQDFSKVLEILKGLPILKQPKTTLKPNPINPNLIQSWVCHPGNPWISGLQKNPQESGRIPEMPGPIAKRLDGSRTNPISLTWFNSFWILLKQMKRRFIVPYFLFFKIFYGRRRGRRWWPPFTKFNPVTVAFYDVNWLLLRCNNSSTYGWLLSYWSVVLQHTKWLLSWPPFNLYQSLVIEISMAGRRDGAGIRKNPEESWNVTLVQHLQES